MQHHPIGSFDWKRIVKRAELHRTTKLIAGFLGDFANSDGTEVRPGVELLADMAGVTTRTVKTHMKVLREAGLIEKTKHSRARGLADVYRLTVPGVDHAPVLMRLDPDYDRLDTAPSAVSVTSTATDMPVDNPVDEVVENLPAEAVPAEPYVKPGAALGETGRRSRGSRLHPSIQTNHYQPQTGSPQPGTSLEAVPTTGQGEPMARGGFEPDEDEFTAARQILMLVPDLADQCIAVANAELAAVGITEPTIRQTVTRAADIATRPAVPDEHRAAVSVADDNRMPTRGA